MRPARSRVPWLAVPRGQAAGLMALVEALRQRLDAPPIDEVRLDDEGFTAGVLELGLGFFRWRTRRILCLGVPFLAAVDETALRAVTAHELGHFSRRHGRLGHWLYRARGAWLWRAQPAARWIHLWSAPWDTWRGCRSAAPRRRPSLACSAGWRRCRLPGCLCRADTEFRSTGTASLPCVSNP
jgi:hypothetical protein